nr:hypothetical protein CFP56_28772 [Quercus suber]
MRSLVHPDVALTLGHENVTVCCLELDGELPRNSESPLISQHDFLHLPWLVFDAGQWNVSLTSESVFDRIGHLSTSYPGLPSMPCSGTSPPTA